MSGDPNEAAGAFLWQIWFQLSIEIDRAAQHGVAEMAFSTWLVLGYLATRRDQAELIDIKEMSERCSLSTTSISRAFAELEAVEYLTGRRADEDGRLVERSLTTAGRAALGRIEKVVLPHFPNLHQVGGDS